MLIVKSDLQRQQLAVFPGLCALLFPGMDGLPGNQERLQVVTDPGQGILRHITPVKP